MHQPMSKDAALRAGVVIGLVLAVITVVEYYVSGMSIAVVGVMTTAALKTIIILQRYMHIGNLWSQESEH